jgi:hypothetical protein
LPNDPPGFKSVTARLTTEQYKVLESLGLAYEGMKPGSVARILVAYAIPRAAEAMGLPAKAVLEAANIPAPKPAEPPG